ncbi:MAG: DUF805 domain-containing protein [Clostridiales bacterium]|jgi:uncharacterized membrane protein YhaH (DUF805 family)|nr:DUF805 domain-containing protein [Clostridiales bacterium]
MEIVNNYVQVLKNYIDFSGRARRREYWLFVLANIIINVVLLILSLLPVIGGAIRVISYIFLVVLLPGLAVEVRRLHDIGKNWYWIFILLVPVVGWIWLIILLATEGEAGDNRFGPNPKGVA